MDRLNDTQSTETTETFSDEISGSKFADSVVDVATSSVSSVVYEATKKPMRPASAGTRSSSGSRSPILPPDYQEEPGNSSQSSSMVSTTLSDKLNYLAGLVRTLEQDEALDDRRRKTITNIVHDLENMMEDEATDTTDPSQDEAEEKEEEDFISEHQLHEIHDSLVSTVHEMRLRTQEQRHLHMLTRDKLASARQQCKIQAHRISTLTQTLETIEHRMTSDLTEADLRRENHILGNENDHLRAQGDEYQAHIKALQAEVSRQSVALSAMNSAITGLEEWMQYTRQESSTLLENHRSRTIVRGKGRFRGRYQVDVEDEGDGFAGGMTGHGRSIHDISRPVDGTDLQDDVRAWIRGCRDVLECAQAGAVLPLDQPDYDDHLHDDEWGDFEAPST